MAGSMAVRRAPIGGFTLVEVLIAATILFTALTVISEAYRASMASSRRAEVVVRLLSPLPFIVQSIGQRLRENPQERLEGRGEIFSVVYKFSAISSKFEPPPSRFEPDLGDFTTYQPRFRLYDVSLTLESEGYTRQFSYQEMAWLPLERGNN